MSLVLSWPLLFILRWSSTLYGCHGAADPNPLIYTDSSPYLWVAKCVCTMFSYAALSVTPLSSWPYKCFWAEQCWDPHHLALLWWWIANLLTVNVLILATLRSRPLLFYSIEKQSAYKTKPQLFSLPRQRISHRWVLPFPLQCQQWVVPRAAVNTTYSLTWDFLCSILLWSQARVGSCALGWMT